MFSRFFIDRPILASVLSIVITIAGLVAAFTLPVAQYPDITPPTIQVGCVYPGANAQVVAATVAAPIEQQVNGVENMFYMSSQCTNDGSYALTITFRLGTNLDMAQVLVQNRVSMALPPLPDMVRQTGVTTQEKVAQHPVGDQPDFARRPLQPVLSEQLRHDPGQGRNCPARRRRQTSRILGQQDYSMRLWLNPDKLATRNLTSRRRRGGPPRTERAGGGRPIGAAAGPPRRRIPIHDEHRSAA